MLTTILLFGFLLVATATDFARHKIYNSTTYLGILTAWGLYSLKGLLVWLGTSDPSRLNWWFGEIGLAESIIGFVLCGFVLLACFVFLQVGGGDVKLIAMMGSFLGYEKGLEAMLWTFVLGGCMGLIVLVWRVGPLQLVWRVMRQILWSLRFASWNPLTPEERAQLQPPLFLAPSALLGVLIVQLALVPV